MFFDKNFNLIEHITDDIEVCFKPITRAFFKRYYKPFSDLAGRLNVQIAENGGALIQQTAILDLEDVMHKQFGDDYQTHFNGIISEIERTILVSIASRDKEAIPFSVARKEKFIDEDDCDLILNTIIFFSCLLLGILPKNDAGLKFLLEQSSIHSTSLSYTEWRKSSATSKTAETTEKKKKTSIPT
ncbi:hypothetical protein [Commensalibacter nepenthis]|uniref:Uncharacterized protein n=1 Tax=Commensalibacter nepenthis TaxID=3043872 RepID=A0ABT6Q8G1_9PROT|nr:hypothetical protein [Commensalibacter sp. TBRC 10068]MDI2113071.1 hypothetical protein [Commensalibacter sp. TBRC 10068]